MAPAAIVRMPWPSGRVLFGGQALTVVGFADGLPATRLPGLAATMVA
jgi:hypothetical protein